jgi:hypothetical protein
VPRRSWVLAAASAVLIALSAVTVPQSAVAGPRVAASASDTSIDEKYQAAAVLGWVPREEVTLADRDFVTVLWEKADDRHNPEVKKAAQLAFSDPDDAAAASTQFIQVGIFEANDRDVALKAQRAELDTIRLRAAQEINWVPASTTERNTMLDETLQNFMQDLWRHATTWPEVKSAAELLTPADVTDDARLTFLKTDLFTDAEADRQNEIAQGNADQVAAQQAAATRAAKEKAIAAGLRRSATAYELDDMEDRELVHEFATDAPGTHVKADAAVAYANPDPDVWRAYFFTGVHLANKLDLDERDLAEARANEVKVRDIKYAAQADGYQPAVVAAADAALQGAALARSQFLLGGYDTALGADTIRPTPNRVVMIQAAGYNGCLTEPLVWRANNGTVPKNARIDPCNENLVEQRWTLTSDNAGHYQLINARLGVCLSPDVAKLQVDGAAIQGESCGFYDGAAKSWDLLDGGKGNVEIRNTTTNKVITAVAGSAAGYLNVVQNPNGHTSAQQWRLIDPSHQGAAAKPPAGSFRIKGVQSGRCVRPAGALDQAGKGALAPWANAEIRDCGTGNEQIWDVVPVSDTRFQLRNRASGWCLYAWAGDAHVVGMEEVVQTSCDVDQSQWVVMFSKSTGSYLRGVTGSYLSALNGGTANGTRVTQADYSTATGEQWTLDPVSDGATPPTQVWASTGQPLTSFSGTAVAFQPECSAQVWIYPFTPALSTYWRADTANTSVKGLIRADLTTTNPGTSTLLKWQWCAVAEPTSSTVEVTLKSIGANAYVREATNVNPIGALVADQTNVNNAGHFIFQARKDVSLNEEIWVLQSKATKKYALINTAATGTAAKAVWFNSATPTAATEIFW